MVEVVTFLLLGRMLHRSRGNFILGLGGVTLFQLLRLIAGHCNCLNRIS